MKKTLAALAVMGAFGATSAFAADVTLYGLVDYGFNYQHIDGDQPGVDAADNFKMMSGQNSGSRFGLKGTEDLGNGLKVIFQLENGFNGDDGTFNTDGKLFDRQATLALAGSFGEVAFGRMGQLASALGSYGLLGNTSPFSSGWQDITGMKFVQAKGHTRYDNMVTYKTPTFAGFNAFAQYTFGNTGDNDETGAAKISWNEGKASADRYYAIGATYKTQNLYLVGIVDSVNYGSKQTYAVNGTTDKDLDDSLTVTVGGNYNFGFMTTYAAFQYFDNALGVGQKTIGTSSIATGSQFKANGAEGYSVALGLGVPAFGGTAKAHVGYVTAEDTKDSDLLEFTRWNLAVGYDYNISKRTTVYTSAAYMQDKSETKGKADVEPSAVEVMAGMIHRF